MSPRLRWSVLYREALDMGLSAVDAREWADAQVGRTVLTDCVIEVSNHVEAGLRVPTADAARSWVVVCEARLPSHVAQAVVEILATEHLHARARRAGEDRIFYSVLRGVDRCRAGIA